MVRLCYLKMRIFREPTMTTTKSINFEPRFHREVCGHAGQVWQMIGAPTDPSAKAEQRQLVAAGCVVSQPAGQPGTGFVQPEEQQADIRSVAIFVAALVAGWSVILALVMVWRSNPLYATLFFMGAFPCALSLMLHAMRRADTRARGAKGL